MPASKLLKLPYGSYLMVRLDYKIICGDELEAKIMRIIEMYMEVERTIIYKEMLNDPQNALDPSEEVEVTRDVWAAISHRLFKNDLYDQEMSENTLKRAIKSLKKKNFIKVRDTGLKRYEAPKYQINTDVVQKELNTLGKLGKTEYQKLMVSKIDGIKNSSHQNETPSEHQNLTPSSASRVSKFDPNSRRVTDSVEDTEEEGTLPAHDHADSGATAPTAPHSQDRDATYEEAWEAYRRIEPNYARTNQMLANGEMPDLKTVDSYSHETPTHEEDTHGHTHDTADPVVHPTRSTLSAENHTGDRRRDRAVPEETQATSERVAPAELSTSRASSAQGSAKVEKKQGSRSKKTEEPIALSPEAEKIWRAWCSLFTVEVELIPSNAKAAEKLVKPARVWCGKLHWTLAQWLKAVKDNAYAADNKGYYSKRGVKLFDIPRELEGWQSAKERELETLAQAANPKPAEPPPVNPTLEALRQQRLHYTGVMS